MTPDQAEKLKTLIQEFVNSVSKLEERPFDGRLYKIAAVARGDLDTFIESITETPS